MMAKKKGRSKDAGPASAPPSPAVVGLMVVVFAACFQGLPTLAELDDVGTYESLTGSSFVSSETLAAARAALALVIFATQAILFFGPGWEEVRLAAWGRSLDGGLETYWFPKYARPVKKPVALKTSVHS